MKKNPIDSDDLDYQHLPRMTVPGAEALLRASERHSARARRKLAGGLGLDYGDSAGRVLDVLRSAQNSAPVNILIHGGYRPAPNAIRATYSRATRRLIAQMLDRRIR